MAVLALPETTSVCVPPGELLHRLAVLKNATSYLDPGVHSADQKNADGQTASVPHGSLPFQPTFFLLPCCPRSLLVYLSMKQFYNAYTYIYYTMVSSQGCF